MPRKPRKSAAPARTPQRPNRIAELTKSSRLTYGKVAERLDVHPVTIANLARGKTELTQSWMIKFGSVFGVPPEEIIAKPVLANLRRIRVTGFIQAGDWSENHEWDYDDQYEVFIPDDAALRRISLYAAEVRGGSMNLRYPDGSVVVLSHVGDSPNDVTVGSRYHVRITRSDGMTEDTLKTLVRRDDGRYWLKPESTEPEFQEWIPLDGRPGVTVELLGKVRYAVQKESS